MARQKAQSGSQAPFLAIGGVDEKTGRPRPSKFEGYLVNVEERPNTFKPGTNQKLYTFQDATGQHAVFEKGNLGRQLDTVPMGSMVWIEYKGKVRTKNGFMASNYEVEFDSEDRLTSLTSKQEDDEEYETEDEIDADVNEAPKPAKVASSGDRKAKLDALLKRK